MTFITNDQRRELGVGYMSIKGIASSSSAILLAFVCIPLVALTLPFVILSGYNLKDGEYWD
jgi:hypothetical protein